MGNNILKRFHENAIIYCLQRVLTGCNDNDDDRDLLRFYLLITTSMVSLNDAEVYVQGATTFWIHNIRSQQFTKVKHVNDR